MFILTTWALRLFGLSGITGSILFIAGDLLYNHIPASPDSLAIKMSRFGERRLLTAGTLGLIGCWFYVLASLQLYLAFRPEGEVFSFILLLAFTATMICYGVSHAGFFSIAAGAQAAARLGSDPGTGGKLGETYFNRLVTITYFPAAVSSAMMAYGILAGRSLYPRWMAACLPIILYLLKIPVTRILRGRLRELVRDSYDNLVLFVFFVISTSTLWNGIVS